MIHVGCSGWNYKDWLGKLYPVKTHDMLPEYSGAFDTVEINTTFYRTPPVKYVDSWIKKSSGAKEFTFSLKFPREVTHELIFRDMVSAKEKAADFENQVVRRIQRSNSLGCVLLQLPPYFGPSNLPYLYNLLDILDTGRIRYFVEVRERNLYRDDGMARTLGERNVGLVDIDSPEKAFDRINSTVDIAYLRFHGRNAASWNKANRDPSERYKYLYSNSELEAFSSIVKERTDVYREVFIYFNNHPGGFAPSNATAFKGMLNLPSSGREVQKTLF